MGTIWILVAESSRAKVYEMLSRKAPLLEIDEFSHPESRQHEHDLTTDLPGRSFDSMGLGGRHAMEARESAKEHEAKVFAKTLGVYLEAARIKKRFDDLIIIAAPAFLGLLRKNLSDGTNQCVTEEIGKNLVQHDVADIRAHLPERLSAI
ncbi:MAG: host cell attachment-required protein [Gammaproteobacteria bacterium]|nr:MAG: host cell attachment-required protein [Gammaproteobacteria bacterium]TND03473.1 MAG: host cell attachment-required protein [Gammaproteobacteria bacterium]